MEGIIFTISIAVIIIFLVWAKRHCHFKSHFCTIANLFIILSLLAILVEALGLLHIHKTTRFEETKQGSVAFSEAKLSELRAAGTPVLVDATASWCITCKVNYKVAIGTEKVQQAFREHGVVYMVADWTNRDAAISQYLTSFGYSGVPLYVYYPPGEKGRVLPQLLTPGLILDIIAPK